MLHVAKLFKLKIVSLVENDRFMTDFFGAKDIRMRETSKFNPSILITVGEPNQPHSPWSVI